MPIKMSMSHHLYSYIVLQYGKWTFNPRTPDDDMCKNSDFLFNPLTARIFTDFGLWLLEGRMLHKGAWVATLLGTLLGYKKVRFPGWDISSLAAKGLYFQRNLHTINRPYYFIFFTLFSWRIWYIGWCEQYTQCVTYFTIKV